MELLLIFLYFSLAFFTKNLESLSNNVLGKDGLTCDDVGWWIGFNKGGNIIYDVDIGILQHCRGYGNQQLGCYSPWSANWLFGYCS